MKIYNFSDIIDGFPDATQSKMIDCNLVFGRLVHDVLFGSKYKISTKNIDTVFDFEADHIADLITSENRLHDLQEYMSYYSKNNIDNVLKCILLEYYCRNINSIEMLLDFQYLYESVSNNNSKVLKVAETCNLQLPYVTSVCSYLELLFKRVYREYGHLPDTNNTDMERLKYFNEKLNDPNINTILNNIEKNVSLVGINVSGIVEDSILHKIHTYPDTWGVVSKLLTRASKQGFVFTNDSIICMCCVAEVAFKIHDIKELKGDKDSEILDEFDYEINSKYDAFPYIILAEVALSEINVGSILLLDMSLDVIVDYIIDDLMYEKMLSKDLKNATKLIVTLSAETDNCELSNLLEIDDITFISNLSKIKDSQCAFLYTSLRNAAKPYIEDVVISTKYVKRINSKNLVDCYKMAGLSFLNTNGIYKLLSKDLELANLIYKYVSSGRISLTDTSVDNIKRIERFKLNVFNALNDIKTLSNSFDNMADKVLKLYIANIDVMVSDPNSSLCCEMLAMWIANNLSFGKGKWNAKYLIEWVKSIDINQYMQIADKYNIESLKTLLRVGRDVLVMYNSDDITFLDLMPIKHPTIKGADLDLLTKIGFSLIDTSNGPLKDLDRIKDTKMTNAKQSKESADIGSPEDTVDISTYTPQAIVNVFDKYVVGQLDTKRALAVSMRNRWRRSQLTPKERVFINKNNVMIKGPTGCGKTALLKVLRLEFGLPIIEVDMSEYTATGYVGKNISDLPGLLLRFDCPTPEWYIKLIKAKGDSDKINKKFKSEFGVIFLDEIDKLIVTDSNSGNLGTFKQEVQYNLLKIIEGGIYESLDMSNVLFIAAGAFSKTDPTDFAPEFLGRFPIRTELKALTKKDLIHLLKLESSPLKAATKLISVEGVTVISDDDTIEYIAEKVVELNTENNLGARNVTTVVESVFEDVYFDTTNLIDNVFNITGKVLREKQI